MPYCACRLIFIYIKLLFFGTWLCSNTTGHHWQIQVRSYFICGKKLLEGIACPMGVRSLGVSWGLFWQRIWGKICVRSTLSSADPEEAGDIMSCSSHLVLLLGYLLWYLVFSVFPTLVCIIIFISQGKNLKGKAWGPQSCTKAVKGNPSLPQSCEYGLFTGAESARGGLQGIWARIGAKLVFMSHLSIFTGSLEIACSSIFNSRWKTLQMEEWSRGWVSQKWEKVQEKGEKLSGWVGGVRVSA